MFSVKPPVLWLNKEDAMECMYITGLILFWYVLIGVIIALLLHEAIKENKRKKSI